MICITITPTSLSVKGHAGYNPGNDIVCAAVSALVQNFEQSARELTTDTIISSMEDGDAVITWPRAPVISIDFSSRIVQNIQTLQTILGITNMTPMAACTLYGRNSKCKRCVKRCVMYSRYTEKLLCDPHKTRPSPLTSLPSPGRCRT